MKNITAYGLEGYSITPTGEVYSHKTNKFLRLQVRSGYLTANLMIGKKFKNFDVHRLLMLTFRYEDGCESLTVNHINGDKQDNRFENLEWVSKGENLRHALKTGLRVLPKGIDHPRCKLSEDDVREIIRVSRLGIEKQSDIARRYGISQNQVSIIKRGKQWSHLEV